MAVLDVLAKAINKFKNILVTKVNKPPNEWQQFVASEAVNTKGLPHAHFSFEL